MASGLYVAGIASALTVAISMPLGYVPGTDLHAIKELKAAEYVKTCRRLAGAIKRGKIVTDPGFESFRELWQKLEKSIAIADIDEQEVWSVAAFRRKYLSDVLEDYISRVDEERDLIVRQYMGK
jgi:hypothetical protein